jgi:hypothetical protein
MWQAMRAVVPCKVPWFFVTAPAPKVAGGTRTNAPLLDQSFRDGSEVSGVMALLRLSHVRPN